MINARAETAAVKPAFRGALRQRRCLIPTDGYYEWTKDPSGSKLPWLIRLRGGELFAFGGLWEYWEGLGGEGLESCTILTGQANGKLASLHERMPIVVSEEDHAQWLDPEERDVSAIQNLLRPLRAEFFEWSRVSPRVNSVSNDDITCIEPLETAAEPSQIDLF